jgi:hypothetical protein
METGTSEALAFPTMPPLLVPSAQYAYESHAHSHSARVSYEQPDELVSRRAQLAAVVGNLVVGSVETVVSMASSALSGISDGFHNVFDGITYWKQFENLRGHLTEEQRQRNRRISYWLLSTTATVIGVKAGYDFVSGHEGEQHPLHIYAAAGSLALNGLVLGAVVRGVRTRNGSVKSVDKEDVKGLLKHFLISDIPSSAIAVLGAVLYKNGLHNVEQAMTAIASGTAAWIFRPTANNLKKGRDHNHFAVCDHEEHDHSHDHHHRETRQRGSHRYIKGRSTTDYSPGNKNWFQRIIYEPRHAKRY